MTSCSQFAGILDHVFVSSGEPGSVLSISGVLGFPKGADAAIVEQETAGHGDSSHDDVGETRKVCADRSEEPRSPTGSSAPTSAVAETAPSMASNESIGSSSYSDDRAEMFGPIPDEIWGSDHLALGVELTLAC